MDRGGGAEIIKRGMFLRLERSLSRPEIALSRIGALVTSRSQKAFDLQARFGRPWPDRWTPNVPGILSDLDRGVSVKERRFKPRPVLMDTGRLRQSIQWRIESADTVAIGTNLPYAKKHQFGLADSITVTQRMRDGLAKFLRSGKGLEVKRAKAMRRNLRSWIKKSPGTSGSLAQKVSELSGFIKEHGKGRGAKWREDLGWIFSMKTIDFIIRKRPFIGVDEQDKRDIRLIIRGELPGRK